MQMEVLIAYTLTVLALMSTPGPSHLLMLSNSASNGFRRSLATAAGDLTANMLQMLAAGLGLSALIMAAPKAFIIIKIAGVLYLVWLGIQMIRKSFSQRQAEHTAPRTSLKTLWLQGFITSATNPKAVVFFAALFPQFIASGAPFWPQFLILSAAYIIIDGIFLSFYGFTASRLREFTASNGAKWIDRLGGVGILIAAVLLGLKSMSRP
ncbi:MAG: lysine transporter LysE [Robiginitomaculum sp.]|nr:MAG: lysine transporter LysE [Robiginitomaculum sp.]